MERSEWAGGAGRLIYERSKPAGAEGARAATGDREALPGAARNGCRNPGSETRAGSPRKT